MQNPTSTTVGKHNSGNNIKILVKASDDNVQIVYTLGENELAQHQVKIKDMQTGAEQLQDL